MLYIEIGNIGEIYICLYMYNIFFLIHIEKNRLSYYYTSKRTMKNCSLFLPHLFIMSWSQQKILKKIRKKVAKVEQFPIGSVFIKKLIILWPPIYCQRKNASGVLQNTGSFNAAMSQSASVI